MPNRVANTVSVIDPATLKVIDTFKVGVNPQHVVPSWDLRTLWVANNAEGRTDGSLTPIDPKTGKPGQVDPRRRPVQHVLDARRQVRRSSSPRRYKRLDFRDPQTMELAVLDRRRRRCAGINHADFSIDGRFADLHLRVRRPMTKIDLVDRKVLGTIRLSQYFARPDVLAVIDKPGKKPKKMPDPAGAGEICTTPGMPQDVRISPDGKRFYVADMMADGVHVIDGESFKQIGFIPTGVGAHGLYPSRDGKKLYVANRGTQRDRAAGPAARAASR